MNSVNSRPQPRIIYDFGSNNGDDLPYYLKKADVVVAVEANPVLCEMIERRFADEIRASRLFVENCVLVEDGVSGDVDFYLCRSYHILSQFPEPEPTARADFEKVLLPSRTAREIIEQYGEPYYIKVDIEHYDDVILRSLFRNSIFPSFISAESHSAEVFASLLALGRYKAFKLVDGSSVEKSYRDAQIETLGGREIYSFPNHSAGPFGDDIAGSWMTPDAFFEYLGATGLGWKDIHASLVLPESGLAAAVTPPVGRVVFRAVKHAIKPRMPVSTWAFLARLRRHAPASA